MKLRHTVTIRRHTNTMVNGENVVTWTDVEDVYASVEPQAGRLLQQVGVVQAQQVIRVQTRWADELDDVVAGDIIIFGDRLFDITTVTNVNQMNRDLIFIAMERAPRALTVANT